MATTTTNATTTTEWHWDRATMRRTATVNGHVVSYAAHRLAAGNSNPDCQNYWDLWMDGQPVLARGGKSQRSIKGLPSAQRALVKLAEGK